MATRDPNEKLPRVAVPNAPAKPPAARRKPTVFPVALPRIPDSMFPIKSQDELVTKISRLFLRQAFTHPATKGTSKSPLLPTSHPSGGGKKPSGGGNKPKTKNK